MPKSEVLDHPDPDVTAISPYGKTGMQRRVTALLGRSSSRSRGLISIPPAAKKPLLQDHSKLDGDDDESSDLGKEEADLV